MLKYFLTAKNQWTPRFLAYSAKIAIRLLLRTCRFEVHGLEHFSAIATDSPCILMLWHNRLIVVAEILHRFAPQFIYTAFVSNSRDGLPLSLMALSYKAGRVLKVPHNARRKALKEMIMHLKNRREVILITPDGPRGPRYVLKPGVVLAAREASAKVIPFTWEADGFWQLGTWDNLRIPKPFSKIKIFFGNALMVSKENKRTFEEEVALFQTALQQQSAKK